MTKLTIKKISFITITLVIALIFIAPLLAPTIKAKAAVAPDFYKAWFFQVGLLIISGLWCFLIFISKNEIKKTNKFTVFISSVQLLLISLVLFGLLSLTWAFHLNLGEIALSRWLIAALLFFLLPQLIFNFDEDIFVKKLMIIAIAMCAVLVTLLGLAQYYEWTNFVLQAVKPASTFGNRNMAMHFIILSIPLFIIGYLINKKPQYVFLWALGFVILSVYIYYSRNRTSWLAYIIQNICWLVLIYYLNKKQNSILKNLTREHLYAGVIAVFLILLATNINEKGQFELFGGDDAANRIRAIGASGGTINERIIVFKNTMYMLKDNLIEGVGFGNWTVYYPKYTGTYYMTPRMSTENPASSVLFKQTHNEYLQLIAELGLVGFILAVLTVITIFYMGLKLIRKFNNSDISIYSGGFLIALSGISINMMASFPLRVSIPIIIIFSYSSIIIMNYFKLIFNYENKQDYNISKFVKFITWHKQFQLDKRIFLGLAIIFFIGAFFTFKTYQKWILAHQLRNTAAALTISNKIDHAIQIMEKSIEINPADPDDGYYILGNLYKAKGLIYKAIETYNYAFNYSLPYHPYMYLQLSDAYANKLGRYHDAINIMQKATKLMPIQGGYYYELGNNLARLKRNKEAIEAYKKALKYAPKHPFAEKVKQILQKVGQLP